MPTNKAARWHRGISAAGRSLIDAPLQTLQAFRRIVKFFTHAHFTVVKVLACTNTLLVDCVVVFVMGAQAEVAPISAVGCGMSIRVLNLVDRCEA
jgi:hypothetical protein